MAKRKQFDFSSVDWDTLPDDEPRAPLSIVIVGKVFQIGVIATLVLLCRAYPSADWLKVITLIACIVFVPFFFEWKHSPLLPLKALGYLSAFGLVKVLFLSPFLIGALLADYYGYSWELGAAVIGWGGLLVAGLIIQGFKWANVRFLKK